MTHLEKSLSKLRKDIIKEFDVIDGVLNNINSLKFRSECIQNEIDNMRITDLENDRNSYTADFHQKHLDKSVFFIKALLDKVNY